MRHAVPFFKATQMHTFALETLSKNGTQPDIQNTTTMSVGFLPSDMCMTYKMTHV